MSQRGDSRGSQGSSRASSSTSTGLTQDLDAMNEGDEDQASPRAGTRSNPMAVAGVQALSKPDLDERKLESFQRQHSGEWSTKQAAEYSKMPASTHNDQYRKWKDAGAGDSLPVTQEV